MFNTIPDNSKPIFGSYSHQDPDFNENMDEYVKSANDIYVEEQKRTAAERRRKESEELSLGGTFDARMSSDELPLPQARSKSKKKKRKF